MNDSNRTKPAPSTAGLIKTSPAASVELTEDELSKVAGGDGVTVNKAKTADKAFKAMDAYIRG